MPPCPRCIASRVNKDGGVGETRRFRRRTGRRTCRRTFIMRTGTPFAGQRWPQADLAV